MVRIGTTWTICNAPPEIFGPYEDIRPEYQRIIEEMGSLPCEGYGPPGVHCGSGFKPCPWNGGSETEVEEA